VDGGSSLAGGAGAARGAVVSSGIGAPCAPAGIEPPARPNDAHRRPLTHMAKRQRAVRPGQRKTTTRTAPAKTTAAATTAPAQSLTAADEARAAELEAQIVAEDRAAETSVSRSRIRRADDAPRTRTREAATLTARATTEYAYVVSDLRRIVVVAGALLAAMLVLWIIMAASGNLTF
jgi:hypothetical protein